MNAQAKLYETVHETFVFISYVSSKGSDEPAHLHSITIAFAARTERMKQCRWRFRLNFMRQFMKLLYLSHMRATKAPMSLHICAVSPQPLQLALKEWSDVDEGSGQTLSLLRRWICCCWSFFNVPPIGLWGPCLVMHYLVLFLGLQSPWQRREKSIMSYLNCVPTI